MESAWCKRYRRCVLVCNAARSLGEQHSLLLAEREEVIVCMEPPRGKDFEWKGQRCQYFCWIDFSTTKCRCRDIATAKKMTWRRQNEHIMDTGGNGFNSVPGSHRCGSENTLQNILLVNLPPCCGMLSNYKHKRHLVYVGCSKSAAVVQGCHRKLLALEKGRKKSKKKGEKSKVGTMEDRELKKCCGSMQSNCQAGLWKQRVRILK